MNELYEMIEKKIKESITDTGIQKILLNYLSAKGNNPEVAFTPEGIEEILRKVVADYEETYGAI